MENILLINLLGKRFYLPSTMIDHYPQTLLGNELSRSKYYRNETKDYYFQRNPLLFSYLLTYYTLERRIFCPRHIPRELLEDECRFFQLENPIIDSEMNPMKTYQYFPRRKKNSDELFIHSFSSVIGVLFLIRMSLESSQTTSLWFISYFIELFSTLSLTSTILYQFIFNQNLRHHSWLLLDLFSIIFSFFIITTENLYVITSHPFFNYLNFLLKTLRLLILIGHLRILRLILRTFIDRYLR